jgi:aspartate/methionine/tyrosine aminotransferase
MFSRRVQDAIVPSPLSETFFRVLNNAYHPSENPNGIISLGIAENTLMYPELATFIDKNMTITPDLFGYGAVSPGLRSLIDGLVRLYNSETFNPVISVEGKDLFFSNGCTALLDNLFWCMCDEGDGALIAKPLYGGFVNDMKIRSKVKLVAVSLKDQDPFSGEAIGRFEEALFKAESEGIKVRVLVLCTPHNPLGQ